MAVIVEDGSIVTDANSYASVVIVDAYFTLRANADWTDLDALDKDAAVIRATAALDAKYSTSWVGIKSTQAQSLAWPRVAKKDSTTGVLDSDGYEILYTTIPQQVIDACCEVALIEVSTRFLSQSVEKDDLISNEKVGPLSTSWFAGAPTTVQYPHIDSLLTGLASSASSVQIEIALTDREKSGGEVDGDVFSYPDYFHLVKYP